MRPISHTRFFVFGLTELEVERLVEELELKLDLQKITLPFQNIHPISFRNALAAPPV